MNRHVHCEDDHEQECARIIVINNIIMNLDESDDDLNPNIVIATTVIVTMVRL